MSVYFSNAEAIDLNAIRLMGVSVKEGENPIGFFGTGLKFGIATILRLGCSIRLIRDGEAMDFTVKSTGVRGQDFQQVFMNGEPLGFTTQLGRNWEMWQAYRELYCNCLDEGGVIADHDDGKLYGTTFVVTGDAFEKCHRERHTIILQSKPLESDFSVEVHKGESQSIFYRKIRAGAVEQPMLFTYNLLSEQDLTEDRTIKSLFWAKHSIAQFVVQRASTELVEKVITAPEGTFESSLNFGAGSTPSESFMEAVGRHRSNFHISQSARSLWESHAETAQILQAVKLDSYELDQLKQAQVLLRKVNCPITESDFVVVETLGAGVYGLMRKGEILIAKRTFDMGTRFLASTLFEEWLHKEASLEDETRDLQNYLFERLFSVIERLVAAERASGMGDTPLEMTPVQPT